MAALRAGPVIVALVVSVRDVLCAPLSFLCLNIGMCGIAS